MRRMTREPEVRDHHAAMALAKAEVQAVLLLEEDSEVQVPVEAVLVEDPVLLCKF